MGEEWPWCRTSTFVWRCLCHWKTLSGDHCKPHAERGSHVDLVPLVLHAQPSWRRHGCHQSVSGQDLFTHSFITEAVLSPARRADVVIATDKEDMVQKVMDLTGVQCPAVQDTYTLRLPKAPVHMCTVSVPGSREESCQPAYYCDIIQPREKWQCQSVGGGPTAGHLGPIEGCEAHVMAASVTASTSRRWSRSICSAGCGRGPRVGAGSGQRAQLWPAHLLWCPQQQPDHP